MVRKPVARLYLKDRQLAAKAAERVPVGRLASMVMKPQEDNGVKEEKVSEEGVGSDIVVMQGPGGLIITSDDKEALERFDRMMRHDL